MEMGRLDRSDALGRTLQTRYLSEGNRRVLGFCKERVGKPTRSFASASLARRCRAQPCASRHGAFLLNLEDFLLDVLAEHKRMPGSSSARLQRLHLRVRTVEVRMIGHRHVDILRLGNDR